MPVPGEVHLASQLQQGVVVVVGVRVVPGVLHLPRHRVDGAVRAGPPDVEQADPGVDHAVGAAAGAVRRGEHPARVDQGAAAEDADRGTGAAGEGEAHLRRAQRDSRYTVRRFCVC